MATGHSFLYYTVLLYYKVSGESEAVKVARAGQSGGRYGAGPAEVTVNCRTTCCSQFDSNTFSLRHRRVIDVSTVRPLCPARIFEVLKSRKLLTGERVGMSIAWLNVRLG